MKFLFSKTGVAIIILVVISGLAIFQSGVFGNTRLGITLQTGGVVDEGLVAHYTFDAGDLRDNVTDATGNGNTAGLVGFSSTTTVPGRIGQGLEFDGTNDYIDAGNLGSNVQSIAFWVNTSSSSQDVLQLSDASGEGGGSPEADIPHAHVFTTVKDTTHAAGAGVYEDNDNSTISHATMNTNGFDDTEDVLLIADVQFDVTETSNPHCIRIADTAGTAVSGTTACREGRTADDRNEWVRLMARTNKTSGQGFVVQKAGGTTGTPQPTQVALTVIGLGDLTEGTDFVWSESSDTSDIDDTLASPTTTVSITTPGDTTWQGDVLVMDAVIVDNDGGGVGAIWHGLQRDSDSDVNTYVSEGEDNGDQQANGSIYVYNNADTSAHTYNVRLASFDGVTTNYDHIYSAIIAFPNDVFTDLRSAVTDAQFDYTGATEAYQEAQALNFTSNADDYLVMGFVVSTSTGTNQDSRSIRIQDGGTSIPTGWDENGTTDNGATNEDALDRIALNMHTLQTFTASSRDFDMDYSAENAAADPEFRSLVAVALTEPAVAGSAAGVPGILIDSNTASTSGITSPTFYVDGVQTSALPVSEGWKHVVVTTGTAIDAGTTTIGTIGGFFDGTIDDVRFYSKELSADEARRVYELGATTNVNTTIAANDNLERGLVAHWTFDGSEYDSSSTTGEIQDRTGNVNPANLINQVTLVPGVIGQALYFDGTTDWIDVRDQSELNNINPMTACAWINVDSDNGNENDIFSKFGSDFLGWVFYTETSGQLAFYHAFDGGSNGSWSSVNNVIDYGNWQHVCMTYDDGSNGNDPLFYINGASITVQQDSGPTGSARSDSTNDLAIGANDFDGSVEEFNGFMDDARIYDRILSVDEIVRLYQLGATTKINKTVANNPDLENGLVTHYTFDGAGTNDLITDFSGSGYHAALSNDIPAMPTTTLPGRIGQSLYLDGDNVASIIGDTDDTMTTFTACGWIWFDAFDNTDTDGTVTVFYKSWELRVNSSGVPSAQIPTSSVFGSVSSSETLRINEWYHLCFTHDGVGTGDTPRIYVNAVDRSTSGADGSGTQDNDSAIVFVMGSLSNVYVNNLPGRFDEVRVYDRVLSQDEITMLYQLGN